MAARFFQTSGGEFVKVPHGSAPEDMGVDAASATEVDRLPKDHESRVGNKWVLDDKAVAKAKRDREITAKGSIGRYQELEDRIAALEATVAALANKG